ncbi:MAG: DUF748 domain-containing protein [Marinobacterium sp.]|nr:DUF748 domain-containing protein [Marinobacterium sp.]
MGILVKLSVTLLIVLGLGLFSLPYLVRDQLVLWAYSQGVDDARLERISINWLTGQLRLSGLVLQRRGQPSLQLDELLLDVDLAALKDKRLLVERLQLSGLQGALRQHEGQLWLGPLPLPVPDAAAEEQSAGPVALAWQAGLQQFAVDNLRWQTRWHGQTFNIDINQARLSDLYQWTPDQPAQFSLDGALDGAAVQLDSQLRPLTANPDLELQLTLKQLPLDAVMALIGQPLKATLSSDLKLTASLKPLHVRSQGSLALGQVHWDAQQQTTLQQLRWQGKADWREADSTAQLDGKLALKQLAARVPLSEASQGTTAQLSQETPLPKQDKPLQAQLMAADWQGNVALTLADGEDAPLQLTVNQQLQLNGLQAQWQQLDAGLGSLNQQSAFKLSGASWQLTQPQLQLAALQARRKDQTGALYPLLTLEQLQLDKLSAQVDKATLGKLSMTNLQLARHSMAADSENQSHSQALSYWQQLQLSGLAWQPAQLRINQLAIGGGESWLLRDKTGALTDVEMLQQQLMALIPSETGKASAADTDKTSDTGKASDTDKASDINRAPLRIVLAELALTKPHQLYFEDRAVSPLFRLNGELQQLVAGPYDSEGQRPLDLNLLAALNGDGELKLDATLDTRTLQSGGWALDIGGVELPYTSPYSMQYTGYFVKSGQLDLQSRGTLAAGLLEGKTDIELVNFDVEPRVQSQVDQVSKRLSMPLETALMVLENSDRNIKLELDLSGSLDDPNFGYQSVINSLAGKGLKTAAVSFLTRSLQPYATLVSLAKTAIDAEAKGTFITLQPVAFSAGTAVLSADMRGYIDKLSGMLIQRPAMRLRLCGNAVKRDHDQLLTQLLAANKKREKPLADEVIQTQLTEQLQTLAEQRSEAVKAALAEQTDKKRLFICYPQVDSSSDADPGVAIGI